ncbi:acyl-CoA thioesterase [Deinococcus hopiensis]|uniref:Acyl-CoA thioester hydrolase n=1 Tax=Deinococcus hopiensis KR-140 TaxID=695939 RepID=A0A1W1VCF1_9DEIO|nr:thioesterase family protein [Deinococcus hopiensis]SMB90644.1 acyl-CoA thioester hydrolase [Deinococcus hopiensis KR-140]
MTGPQAKGRGVRTDYRHLAPITTRWMDNDVYGHVNNATYYSYFDTAVNTHLIRQGALGPAHGPVIGLVVESGCRYAAPISFPDAVTAGLRVGRVGSSSVRYEIGLFRNGESQAAAEGFFIHVYVDRETRRPVPLPPELRRVVEGLLQ